MSRRSIIPAALAPSDAKSPTNTTFAFVGSLTSLIRQPRSGPPSCWNWLAGTSVLRLNTIRRPSSPSTRGCWKRSGSPGRFYISWKINLKSLFRAEAICVVATHGRRRAVDSIEDHRGIVEVPQLDRYWPADQCHRVGGVRRHWCMFTALDRVSRHVSPFLTNQAHILAQQDHLCRDCLDSDSARNQSVLIL